MKKRRQRPINIRTMRPGHRYTAHIASVLLLLVLSPFFMSMAGEFGHFESGRAGSAAGADIYVVYGYVHDLLGDPMADVPVNVTNRDTGETLNTTTDSDGYYQVSLTNFFPGNFVYVQAWVYNLSSSASFNIGDGPGSWANITLPTPLSVRGVVVASDGKPLAGVPVQAVENGTGESSSEKTLPNGVYEIHIYDYNPGDTVNVSVPAVAQEESGGEGVAFVIREIRPRQTAIWANLSLHADIYEMVYLSNSTVEVGGETSLSIWVQNTGNTTGNHTVSIDTPLVFVSHKLPDGVASTGYLSYATTLGPGEKAIMEIVFTTPPGAEDGDMYVINVSFGGKDIYGHPTAGKNEALIVAVSTARINPRLVPASAYLTWDSTWNLTLYLNNTGSEKAASLATTITVPPEMEISVSSSEDIATDIPPLPSGEPADIEITMSDVQPGQHMINLSLNPTSPPPEYVEITGTVSFTNATHGTPISLPIKARATFTPLRATIDTGYGRVVKGDTDLEIEITVKTTITPMEMWVNTTSPIFIPAINTTMHFANTSRADYSAYLYVPLVETDRPYVFTVSVDMVSKKGWHSTASYTGVVMAIYHYIQGNITYSDGKPVDSITLTMLNTNTGDTHKTTVQDGFYRFDTTVTKHTTLPGDTIYIYMGDRKIGETKTTNNTVDWYDITLPETSPVEDRLPPALCFAGVTVLLVLFALLLLWFWKKSGGKGDEGSGDGGEKSKRGVEERRRDVEREGAGGGGMEKDGRGGEDDVI